MNVTMEDAIAAGNGTLHGAIDYWQSKADEYKQQRDELVAALLAYPIADRMNVVKMQEFYNMRGAALAKVKP